MTKLYRITNARNYKHVNPPPKNKTKKINRRHTAMHLPLPRDEYQTN